MQVISSSTGRYRIQGPVGTGPDGPVHRAVAERLGSRPTALRRVDVPAGAARARLRRDAETVAALGHPGLALVTDVLEVDERSVLVACSLGTRGSLEDRLVLGRLSVDEAIDLVRTVAGAVAAAHGVGLAHGRLSARNIVFTDDGPVVTDLVQAAALGRGVDPAHDVVAVRQVATSLVDLDDHGRRACAYRAICRWSFESDAGLVDLVRALDRLDEVADPGPIPAPATPSAPAAVDGTTGSALSGLVVATALGVGATIGVVGSLLPVL